MGSSSSREENGSSEPPLEMPPHQLKRIVFQARPVVRLGPWGHTGSCLLASGALREQLRLEGWADVVRVVAVGTPPSTDPGRSSNSDITDGYELDVSELGPRELKDVVSAALVAQHGVAAGLACCETSKTLV